MTLQDTDLFNLPDAPDFISETPRYSIREFIALFEKSLPYWNEQRYRYRLAEASQNNNL